MTTPQVQNDPVYSLPFTYMQGFAVSNDATTPNTVLNIAAGQCRDSNDVMDICLGAANPNLAGITTAAPLSLNAATTGVNALDTGTLAASTVYAVYIIADSRYIKATASILTLASNSSPLLPFGYDSYRQIGYAITDSSSHFLAFYQVGNGGQRQFFYDTPQATAITAGAATSYTAVDLSALVPNVANTPVVIFSALTPSAAGRGVFLQGAQSTGDQIVNLGQVTSVVLNSYNTVLAQIASSKPEVKYKVSNGSDAVALKVAGFSFSV